MRPVTCAVWVALLLPCCADRAGRPAHGTIGGDLAGRVGDVGLPSRLVAAVARAKRLSPPAALALLIDDAAAATAARARGLDGTSEAMLARAGILARATIDHIRQASRATPPSDDEVAALSAAHWVEVDAPETFEVIHAVVRRPTKPDPRLEAEARSVAVAIASAVAEARDAADFEARANAVPHGAAEVVVQPLQPFTADGRVAVNGAQGGYDVRFTGPAAALSRPGATTGVVESSFGWHVIRLLARHPAQHVPLEKRRDLFAPEVFENRARSALEALEAQRRSTVVIANGIDELLASAAPASRDEGGSSGSP